MRLQSAARFEFVLLMSSCKRIPLSGIRLSGMLTADTWGYQSIMNLSLQYYVGTLEGLCYHSK